MSERTFPILGPATGRATGVPWAWIEQFSERASHTHGQSLEELSRRGGLSPGEIWLLIIDSSDISRLRKGFAKGLTDAHYQDVIDRHVAAWRVCDMAVDCQSDDKGDEITLIYFRIGKRAGWSVRHDSASGPLKTFKPTERLQAIAFAVRAADRMGVRLLVHTEDGSLEGTVQPERQGQAGVA